MIVKVTQEHIDKAQQEDCRLCPVEQALIETFKVKKAYAFYQELVIGEFPDDTLVFNVPTPPQVLEWMLKFDKQEQVVQPFEFELSLEGVKL